MTHTDSSDTADNGWSQWVVSVSDVIVSISAVLVVSSVIGIGWSYLRTGLLIGSFVREAQFLIAFITVASWTVRNRSGGQIDAVESSRSIFVLPPAIRITLNPLLTTDSAAPSALLTDDVHLFVSACAVGIASIGIEILIRGGTI